MPMKMHMNLIRQACVSARKKQQRSAFTLIELLVVVAIIALLLALGGLGIGPSMSAMQLSGAANNLSATLNHAALLARKENRPVQVRFYKYGIPESPTPYYRAYQLAILDGITSSGGNDLRLLTEVMPFPEGVVLAPNATHNTLAALGETPRSSNDPVLQSNYTYSSFEIRPDGLTTLPKDEPSVITLLQEAQMKDAAALPANYRSIVINAMNARAKVY